MASAYGSWSYIVISRPVCTSTDISPRFLRWHQARISPGETFPQFQPQVSDTHDVMFEEIVDLPEIWGLGNELKRL